MPKNFINTQQNIDDKKQLGDAPVYINLSRKEKGANWHTTGEFKIVFKRPIAINGLSYNIWNGKPPKEEPEKKDTDDK